MKPLGTVIILLILCDFTQAQVRVQAHAGAGFTEHFSIGVGCTFAETHAITLLYGSDFFYHPKEFSTYMLQYAFAARRWRFSKVTPIVGLKGGHAIFTDKYYTWEVMVFVPFAGLQYPLSGNIDLTLQAGGAISFEQKAERLNYGEIGHYRQYLPELKAGIVYDLKKKGR